MNIRVKIHHAIAAPWTVAEGWHGVADAEGEKRPTNRTQVLPSLDFFLRTRVPPNFPRKDSSFFIFVDCDADIVELSSLVCPCLTYCILLAVRSCCGLCVNLSQSAPSLLTSRHLRSYPLTRENNSCNNRQREGRSWSLLASVLQS